MTKLRKLPGNVMGKRVIAITLLTLVFTLSLALPVFAGQEAIQASKDTDLMESNPTNNYGAYADVALTDGDAAAIRTILEFETTETARPISATLYLYYYDYISEYYTDPVGRTVWAYKLSRTNWVEGDNGAGSGATWNTYDGSNTWTAPGGDYVTSAPSGVSTTFPASYGWMSWDVTAIVVDAYENGNAVELLIKYDAEKEYPYGEGSSFPSWYSRDSETPSLRPHLVITYAPFTPVPILQSVLPLAVAVGIIITGLGVFRGNLMLVVVGVVIGIVGYYMTQAMLGIL